MAQTKHLNISDRTALAAVFFYLKTTKTTTKTQITHQKPLFSLIH